MNDPMGLLHRLNARDLAEAMTKVQLVATFRNVSTEDAEAIEMVLAMAKRLSVK